MGGGGGGGGGGAGGGGGGAARARLDDVTEFRLSGGPGFCNAVRRSLLSDLETCMFRGGACSLARGEREEALVGSAVRLLARSSSGSTLAPLA